MRMRVMHRFEMGLSPRIHQRLIIGIIQTSRTDCLRTSCAKMAW